MIVKRFLSESLGNTKYPDLSAMPMEVRAEVIAALNTAIAAYFDLAPDNQKLTGATHQIKAPRSLTGLSVAANSTVNTGTPFLAEDRGKTIRIGDGFNEIVSTTAVLKPNTTAETWTSGTVYDDTVAFFDTSVERIVDTVRVHRGTETWTLPRVEEDRARALFAWAYTSRFSYVMGAYTLLDRATADWPECYSILNVGESIAAGSIDASFLLRIDPLPTAPCVLELKISQLPAMMTVGAIEDGTVLPVRDERIYNCLRPLFVENLMGTSIWTGNDVAMRIAANQAAFARQTIRNLAPWNAPPVMTYGTTTGY